MKTKKKRRKESGLGKMLQIDASERPRCLPKSHRSANEQRLTIVAGTIRLVRSKVSAIFIKETRRADTYSLRSCKSSMIYGIERTCRAFQCLSTSLHNRNGYARYKQFKMESFRISLASDFEQRPLVELEDSI